MFAAILFIITLSHLTFTPPSLTHISSRPVVAELDSLRARLASLTEAKDAQQQVVGSRSEELQRMGMCASEDVCVVEYMGENVGECGGGERDARRGITS